MHDATTHNKSLTGLAMYLLQDSLLAEDMLHTALSEAEKQQLPLSCYLVRNKLLSSEKILACCKKHFELPSYDLANYDLSCLEQTLIQPEFIHRYRALPLYRDEQSLHIGITDPTQHSTLSTISFHTGLQIYPHLVSEA